MIFFNTSSILAVLIKFFFKLELQKKIIVEYYTEICKTFFCYNSNKSLKQCNKVYFRNNNFKELMNFSPNFTSTPFRKMSHQYKQYYL